VFYFGGMAFNIADLFEHAVDAVPDRTALIVDGERRSYAELERNANRLAHHLATHDVDVGDHVGIYGVNSLEWVEAMLAAFKLRAVPINVNYRYVEDELRYLFDNADVRAVVVDRALAPRLASIRRDLCALRHIVRIDGPGETRPDDVDGLDSVRYAVALAAGSPERDFPPRSPDDHYVLYTGGTTGMPKGVVWRHEDVFMALGGGIDATTNEPVASEWALAERARATETPLRSLCMPPLMHGAAQWSVLRFLFDGSTTVLTRRFDPHAAWRIVAEERINSFLVAGDAMARPLIEALDDPASDGLDLSSLFVVASTAAVLSPAIKQRFLARFPSLMLVEAIGSSETGSNGMAVAAGATAEASDGPNVTPARDAVVLDDDLRELPPGSGQIGRLARRGNIPLGYYKDEERTRATFVTGPTGVRYVLAGDLARREADGTITLLGRGSSCINTGGEKVFPEEVERVLKAHPAVFDALVVGVPDDRWGQRVVAVVEPRPGARVTLEELDRHCRQHVAGYKVPRALTVVEAIERSPSGKPDYPWAQRVATESAAAAST
jgi:acyl-CoA synthetase (AMP-forming)/AMP-acid ligase II